MRGSPDVAKVPSIIDRTMASTFVAMAAVQRSAHRHDDFVTEVEAGWLVQVAVAGGLHQDGLLGLFSGVWFWCHATTSGTQ